MAQQSGDSGDIFAGTEQPAGVLVPVASSSLNVSTSNVSRQSNRSGRSGSKYTELHLHSPRRNNGGAGGEDDEDTVDGGNGNGEEVEIEADDTDVNAPTEVMTNRSSDFRKKLWLKTSRPTAAAADVGDADAGDDTTDADERDDETSAAERKSPGGGAGKVAALAGRVVALRLRLTAVLSAVAVAAIQAPRGRRWWNQWQRQLYLC